MIDIFLGSSSTPLIKQVNQHVVVNPEDWNAEQLFEEIGAFEASDIRFTRFLESLASAHLRPDENSQREFAALVNGAIGRTGVELREIGEEAGFPVFRFTGRGQGAGRPKNLIFASRVKPDLRFRDAVSNDIEILTAADQVLVYDRPFPSEGLLWRDLQAWWAAAQGCDDVTAKETLYRRLLGSLPENSPPQTLLFKSYFRHFGQRVPGLPALLPEVWLHWDPKTVRERGPMALTRFRMDFLMLLPGNTRIVLEVDGLGHYTDDQGGGDPERYAAMVRGDRDLQLAGYEVYRFGAVELNPRDAPARTADFFERLLKRHGVAG